MANDPLAPPTSEELASIKASKSAALAPPTKDELRTIAEAKLSKPQIAAEHFGQGLLSGYLPNVEAPIQMGREDNPNISKISVGSHPVLSAAMHGLGAVNSLLSPNAKERYIEHRDVNDERLAQGTKQEPGLALASEMGGGLAQSLLIDKGTSALARLTSPQAGFVYGAMQNPGNVKGEITPFQIEDRLKQGVVGAALGKGTELAGKTVGYLGKTAKELPEKLGDLANSTAFRAVGAMYKDFKSAVQKNRLAELGKEMFESNLVKAGDTVKDIYHKSTAALQDTGAKLGQIYQTIGSKIPVPSAEEVFGGFADSLNKLRSKMSDVDMKKVEDHLLPYMEEFATKSQSGDIRDLHKLKRIIDDKIDYTNPIRDMPELKQGFHALRDTMSKLIDSSVQKFGDSVNNPELFNEFKALNKKFGNLSEISGVAERRVARDSANRAAGLTDSNLAAGGFAHSGPVGLLLGAANKAVRTYGAPLMAQGLNKAASVSKLGVPLGLLGEAAGNKFATPLTAGRVGAGAAGLLRRR